MQRNKIQCFVFMVVSILLAGALFSSHAFAYTIPASLPQTIETTPSGKIIVCPNPYSTVKDSGLVVRIIPCIRDTVVFAASKILKIFSDFINASLLAVVALAISVWGVMLLGGNGVSATKDGVVLAFKIGFVLMFTNSFAGLYPQLLTMLEEVLTMLASLVTSPSGSRGIAVWQVTGCAAGTFPANETDILTVWHMLDCYIDLFTGGIFSPATIASGIFGFVTALVFSSSIGLFIALIGFYIIAVALFTIARVVYIFLTAYIAFSFIIIISPFFVTCLLFANTRRYFDGWLRLAFTFLIQPIFLFGYLIMFLVAFNITVFQGKHSLYYIIAGDDSDLSVNPNFKIGDWLSGKNGSVSVYSEELIIKDNMKVDPRGAFAEVGGALPDPIETALEAVEGKRSSSAPFLVGANNDPTNHFETGVPVRIIDWDTLAKKADSAGYNAAATPAAKDQFVQDYKLSIFLGFLMAAIVIYIFYSLLGFMPYIGVSSLGDVGLMPVLGAGRLATPGSNYFESVK